jgi:Rrf2 family protein
MNINTRFTVALHILTLLACLPGQPQTSEFIASSVNTNPVVIRRLLGMLRKLGIVTSQPGNGGGWLLAADPAQLDLRTVRRAVDAGSPFALHAQTPNILCPVGRNIQDALHVLYHEAEQAMDAQLARTTIASLLESVRQRP